MKFNLLLLLIGLAGVSVFAQNTNDNIAWHKNVKEIQYKIDVYNIEKTVFDKNGRKIYEINYHPLMSPNGLGHGYDSTIYEYSNLMDCYKTYFKWYGEVYYEGQTKTFKFSEYDSIVTLNKKDSIYDVQKRIRIDNDSLLGHINLKPFSADTFYYHRKDEKIIRHEIIFNKEDGKRLYYLSEFIYNEKGKPIEEREISHRGKTIFKYDKNDRLILIIEKHPKGANGESKEFYKEEIKVKYTYY
jgi:hypothetical protein